MADITKSSEDQAKEKANNTTIVLFSLVLGISLVVAIYYKTKQKL
jgi:hypothetical protein